MGPAFEFATAGRIVFGTGSRSTIGGFVAGLGCRLLLVTGGSGRHSAWLPHLLQAEGLTTTVFSLTGEPTIAAVESGAATARAAGCDVVLGLGGGSCLDAAKAIAALAVQPGCAIDYLEVIGAGRPLEAPPLPCVAVPTTAGTGAEVTRNSVLGSPPHRVKVSLRHQSLLPRVAVVDPELTLSSPPGVTAASGLDALSQLVEPFVSSRANPLTDGFCREGLTRIRSALPAVLEAPLDLAARESMSLASLLGGLALANAGLGAVHGFAGPLGGMFSAPHGSLCGRLLPVVMAANIRALGRGRGPAAILDRYREVACLLTGQAEARPSDGVAWVETVVKRSGIPRLEAFGLTRSDIPAAVDAARQASSMKANPVLLDHAELSEILAAAV
jgi:alcohol dehydrogenase class IV